MSDDRFKKLVHYVCWRCASDPDKLGAVKLNKILWIAEQENYYRKGQPLTRVHYIKEKYGPVPRGIVTALRELQREGNLSQRKVPHHDFQKTEFVVNRDPDTDFLPPDEMKMVDQIIEYVTKRHTATSISSKTHDHIWKAALDGEEIPHYTVFARPGKITKEELEWADFALGSEK